ncbi:ATP-binding protein [Dyadobacter sp. CY345]|uniref:DEAD/DEAH box helicase n=1 Tax=Dyadobacter sp. CY345 TaxID=2909335 RepID=UPI001F2E2EA9|nr:ATP-binding protein [Dyadobacter sp. CY345]MCF2447725.1 ATP-binding protein [Dyadobacter sp. CY345]
MNNQESVLSFWRDVEIFSLPDLPRDVVYMNPAKTLPWEMSFKPSKDFTWRHIIYFGKSPKETIANLIKEAVQEEIHEDWVEKPSGNTYMAVMIVNENGQTSHDGGYLQASYLHGIKCLQDNIPISNVNEKLQKTQDEFKERYPANQDAESLEMLNSPILTRAQLKNEVEVLRMLGIVGLRCDDRIYIKSDKVSRNSKPDPSFMNSFYLDDLNALLKEENRGPAIEKYLSDGRDAKPGTDILKDQQAFFELLNPELILSGKWAAKPEISLYTAQMAAVHSAMRELKNGEGIIGVNGPPGTGKTTMLLDIISDIIVERAKILLKEKAGELFGKSQRIERKDSYAYYFPPKSEVFRDIGIVVASNNNAAVENISKELPDEKKIDRASFPDADYLSAFSRDLIVGDAWGLLSAALGNAKNKQAFKNNVWNSFEDDKPKLQKFLLEIYNNPEKKDRSELYHAQFLAAKKELLLLLTDLENFKKEAVQYFSLLKEYLENRKHQVYLTNKVNEAASHLLMLTDKRKAELLNADRLLAVIDSTRQSVMLYQSSKPIFYFFHKLFNTQKYKNWHAPLEKMLNELVRLSTQQSENATLVGNLDQEIEKNKEVSDGFLRELKEIEKGAKLSLKLKASLKEKYGFADNNLPDESLYDLFETNRDAFHRANPWSSKIVNTLRSNIFLKSLKLHELAVLGNAKGFKNNLSLFMEMIDGRVEVSANMAAGLWQSFFFCVPVVSTSLASAGKLFKPLQKSSIAWLLLDEAGQASPQSAAGLINRVKRSIIVGDPLQIEPVMTIPQSVVQILNSAYKTDRLWSPLHTSVQKLADRITQQGTWVNGGEEEDIWTGLPLRAHRRCDNPMFDIANAIAYNGQMVKVQNDVDNYSPLGKSCWLDVTGTTIEARQVIVEELEVLVRKVSMLTSMSSEIFVISPFKSVATACEKVLKDILPNVKCGTIHTFQGKEADIVFLVLGSAPDKPASRQWASQKPNMLNVALTRAKRRFYVIGNKKLWGQNPYFDKLAADL